MKRSLFDSEYHRVRDRSTMKAEMRQNAEFPEDDPERRTPAQLARVAAGVEDFKARVAKLDAHDEKRAAEVKARADARSREYSQRAIKREYQALGIDPPEPLISLYLLRKLGWTVEEIDGKNTLMRPSKQNQRKSREQWEAERNVEGT